MIHMKYMHFLLKNFLALNFQKGFLPSSPSLMCRKACLQIAGKLWSPIFRFQPLSSLEGSLFCGTNKQEWEDRVACSSVSIKLCFLQQVFPLIFSVSLYIHASSAPKEDIQRYPACLPSWLRCTCIPEERRGLSAPGPAPGTWAYLLLLLHRAWK